MLTFVTDYAVRNNLPFEFVEWTLSTFGHDAGDYPSMDTVHREWNAYAEKVA